jgi:4-amino-4-deoxy-L-arabinose transferase-like glycosyltransferase
MTTDAEAATRRHFWLLMLLALVLLGAGIGMRDPWPSDEPRFTLVARQMVESGDWLFPHRGRELYADKPPMLMWLEAASYQVVRDWRIAFMLPSLLAGLLTLALTYDLGRRLWSARAGLYAATAVLFAFQFLYQAKRAQIDPLIMGFITLANWGLLLHFLRGPNWPAFWLGCFFAGIGVITKGVGVLALLMFVPYVYARMRGWEGVTRTSGAALHWLGGAVAFLAAISLWLVPMLLAAKARGGPEYAAYVDDILLKQTAKRYGDSWSHLQPFWYFVPIVLLNWFPLSLVYPFAVPRWVQALKAREPRVLLPIAWALLLIVFFSIPRGKRDVYVMPVIPMVALAMAPYLEEWSRQRWAKLAALAVLVGGGLVALGAGIYASFGRWPLAQRYVEQRGLDDGMAVFAIVIAIGVLALAAAAWGRVERAIPAMLAALAGLVLIVGFWANPVLNDSNSARGIMQKAGALIGPDAELGLVAWKEHNHLMADRPAADFGFKRPWNDQFVEAVAWLAAAPEKRWVFSRDDAIDHCVDRAKAQRVGPANRREWWVFRHEAVVPGCEPDKGGAHEQAAEKKDDPGM